QRLWFPISILMLFGTLALYNRDILFQFRDDALAQSQKVFKYVIEVGIWLSAAHFLNRLIILYFWDGLVRKTIGAPVPRLLKDVLTIIIYTTAVTGIVGIVFNKPVTGFWATSGVVGLILGFALRNIILDVFTGLAINIDRPYRLGDWIMVHGSNPQQNIIGQVTEINWRTTRLSTEDDSVVIMPNSLLGTMVVTNFWGGGPQSRFETAFCLDFSVPTERACRVLQAGAKAAMGQKGILSQPEPNVIVNSTNSLGVEYKVRFWMSSWGNGITQGVARSHLTTSVLEHLKQAGITPAYPKQDLFYAKMPTRQLDSQTLADRIELLGRTELFKHLNTNELKELGTCMKQKRYPKGEKLIKQGDAGNSMFILSEGLLHAFLSTNNNEPEVKVGQIIPGEFFGEMSLLTGEPRSATIVAITDVVAHEITKDNMNALLTKRPEIAETISKVVAERRVRNSQIMATATPEERIEETESLAKQIMSKMKAFFKGVFEKH
ncbi:MAG: cyclic nucleotide-binding domain-containing protein, partial [bacterium]